MSLVDTREIATAKIVMLGGGGGGGSYTAGNGINITNNVITNTRKGALTGIIDSVSSNIAHTQIDNALTTTTAGALVVLKAEASGTSIDTVRVQYGSQASESNDFRLRDTSGNYTTIDVALDDTIIMMLNATGYQMIVLSILGASTGGGYAGLGIGKKTGVTSNVIDTDIDLHRAPIVGDRLLIYFDEKVTNPTGLITYNNGTAVTSGLESVTPLYINAGWNILKYENNLLNTGWVRVQNVPIPNNTLVGLSDTAIVSPSDGQLLTYDNETQKWKNKTYVVANTGTARAELKKIQIGDVVYNADGLKAYNATAISNGAISVSVVNAGHLNGEIIAVNTGSLTGTTTNAWTLALNDGQTIEALTMSKGGSAYTDAITADCLLFVKCDITNSTATLLGIAGAGTTVQANPTGTPTVELNKLKIGNGIYDTSAIRPHMISSISSGSMTVHVTNLDQLNGKVIAICTESNTGTTTLAWELNLSDGGSSAGISMTNADGTDFTDEIVANELLFVYVDADNFVATVLGIAGASGGGGVAESVVGTVESGTTASQPYAVGEHFIRNDKFCTAIAAIASGATLTQGTNYVEGTIAECIARQGIYSTDEVEIGTWFGQKLYRKCYNFGALTPSGGTNKSMPSGLSNITVRRLYGIANSSSYSIILPCVNQSKVVRHIYYNYGTNEVASETTNDSSNYMTYIILEYTKNS